MLKKAFNQNGSYFIDEVNEMIIKYCNTNAILCFIIDYVKSHIDNMFNQIRIASYNTIRKFNKNKLRLR